MTRMSDHQRAILVDIDGTLAHRGDRSPFDWHRVGEDQPNAPVIELVHTLYWAGKHRIILMSGRDETCRVQTEMWLDAQDVPFHDLHMRPAKDNRKDSVVKREMYDRHVAGR